MKQYKYLGTAKDLFELDFYGISHDEETDEYEFSKENYFVMYLPDEHDYYMKDYRNQEIFLDIKTKIFYYRYDLDDSDMKPYLKKLFDKGLIEEIIK